MNHVKVVLSSSNKDSKRTRSVFQNQKQIMNDHWSNREVSTRYQQGIKMPRLCNQGNKEVTRKYLVFFLPRCTNLCCIKWSNVTPSLRVVASFSTPSYLLLSQILLPRCLFALPLIHKTGTDLLSKCILNDIGITNIVVSSIIKKKQMFIIIIIGEHAHDKYVSRPTEWPNFMKSDILYCPVNLFRSKALPPLLVEVQ